MDVIAKLNQLRLERNMSVYRLAEITGINQSTLANTFSRGTVPSIQNLEIICDALGITLAQFFSTTEVNVTMSQNDIKFFNNYKKLPIEVQKSFCDIITSISNSLNKI